MSQKNNSALSEADSGERLKAMAATAPFALRVTPESHVHPSLRLFFEDAELVRLALAALPADADPSRVHVVQFAARSSMGRTNLVKHEGAPVYLGVRGERTVASRLVLGREAALTRRITLVCGPHEGHPTVFTAYWGDAAPREPGDPSHDAASFAESVEFWCKHALVPEPGEQTVINLTPHEITVARGGVTRTLPASGHVARVSTTHRDLQRTVLGAPVKTTTHGAVEGLPDAQEGVTFVVSGLVRAALTGRPDVVSPGALLRDEAGRVIGCAEFIGEG